MKKYFFPIFSYNGNIVIEKFIMGLFCVMPPDEILIGAYQYLEIDTPKAKDYWMNLWKFNFPMRPSVRLLVGRSVCHHITYWSTYSQKASNQTHTYISGHFPYTMQINSKNF